MNTNELEFSDKLEHLRAWGKLVRTLQHDHPDLKHWHQIKHHLESHHGCEILVHDQGEKWCLKFRNCEDLTQFMLTWLT